MNTVSHSVYPFFYLISLHYFVLTGDTMFTCFSYLTLKYSLILYWGQEIGIIDRGCVFGF